MELRGRRADVGGGVQVYRMSSYSRWTCWSVRDAAARCVSSLRSTLLRRPGPSWIVWGCRRGRRLFRRRCARRASKWKSGSDVLEEHEWGSAAGGRAERLICPVSDRPVSGPTGLQDAFGLHITVYRTLALPGTRGFPPEPRLSFLPALHPACSGPIGKPVLPCGRSRMTSVTDSRRACSVQVSDRQGQEHGEKAAGRT